MSEERNKPGPETMYTDELANEICDALASSDDGIQVLCKQNPHWPKFQTIYKWRISNERFGEMYARAKASQVDVLVDMAWDIARNNENDTEIKTSKSGKKFKTCNSEWVNRSRLKVDTIKWLAAILQPRKYSEKYIEKADAQNLVKAIIEKL